MDVADCFKFKLGDTVTHAVLANVKSDAGNRLPPTARWFVVSRLLEECPGGAQKHYRCRGVSRSGSVVASSVDFLEH